MLRFFLNLLLKIENVELTFKDWILAFLGILFVRIFLENFSNIPLSGGWTSDASTIIHYYLYYLAVVLSFILLLGFFIDRAKIERVVLFALIGNWLAPMLDLVISGGKGYFQHYITFTNGAGFMNAFFGFFSPVATAGITPGMRIGMTVGALVIMFYVIYRTSSVAKGVLVSIAAYAISFFWGSLPSFWKLVHDLFSPAGKIASVTDFFISSAGNSVVVRNFFHPTIHPTYIRGLEVFFNVAMSQIYYILVFVLLALYMFLHHREKFFAILENGRQFRAAHYYFMIGIGLFLGSMVGPAWISWNWLDFASLAVLLLCSFCARMYAGGVNDIEDLEIDKISNPRRPLPSGILSEGDIRNANLFFLPWALLGGFLVGQYALFAIIATLFISHIYSVPPLRLRNYPIVATFLIALASFAVFAAGFYFTSPDKTTRALPAVYMLLVILILTLGENVKDIKDIEGDRAAGVLTIPVLFGEKIGKIIVAFLLGISFVLAPLIFNLRILLWLSLTAAAAASFLINRKPYREWSVLLVCFLYAGIALSILGFYGLPALH